MAKKKYDLTKDNASNKSLTSLIDENLQKESELLQQLIHEVVEANKKVKDTHQQRLEEADEKLRILNSEIERLKDEINRKDHETTIEQLSYLLDSKDRIFEALNDMRTQYLDTFLQREYEETSAGLKDRLLTLFEEHTDADTNLTNYLFSFKKATLGFVEETFAKSEQFFSRYYLKQSKTDEVFKHYEQKGVELMDSFEDFHPALKEALESRTHMLQGEGDEEPLEARIQKTYEERKKAYDEKEAELKKTYDEKLNTLDEELKTLEDDTLEKLKNKHKKRLAKEATLKESLQKDLRDLRIDIIKAEKANDEKRLKQLFKAYERKEKSNLNLFEEKLERKAKKQLKPAKEKLYRKRFKIEREHLNKLYRLRFEKQKETIQYQDSHELFKLREDKKALGEDLLFNERYIGVMKEKLAAFETFMHETMNFIKALHDLLSDKHEAFLKTELALLDQLTPLKRKLKKSELELAKQIRLKHFGLKKTGAKINHALKMHAENVEYHQKLYDLEKRITDADKSSVVKRLSDEEQTQSDKIYQQALIELADKEYELQVLKIQSLYDNEMNLTKAQTDRLNIGKGVNEAMVSTTIESQIQFAKQQIQFAESEYELRLENVERSLEKELEYAEEKLSAHRQQYQIEIRDLEQARDDKLEDLAYRKALFTDEKDRRRLEEQEQSIKDKYNTQIAEIKEKEDADAYVQRYRKQIKAAKERAEKAREDAKRLKERSVSTFESMLESSEEKLAQFKDKDSASNTLAPYIESEASKTAQTRLDEALEEAKELYEEKVEKPKQKLKDLNAKLDKLQKQESTNPERRQLETEKENLKEAHQERVDKENQKLEKKLEALENEENAFLEKTENVAKTYETLVVETDKDKLKKELTAQIKALQKQQADTRDKQKTHLENELKTRRERLDSMKKTLDSHIRPTFRQYSSFVKKTSYSQRKKEWKARREIMVEKRKAIKRLKGKYKG